MRLNEYLAKNPKSDPLDVPLGYNQEGELLSFNMAHHTSLLSFGDYYEYTQSMLVYLLHKNKPEDLKVVYYDRVGMHKNLPHFISYNEGYSYKFYSTLQWAVDEVERRKQSGHKYPRVLIAFMGGLDQLILTGTSSRNTLGQMLEMFKYISMFGARYGINLILEMNKQLWKEENDELLGAFSAWVTPGGTFENSNYLTGDRYTFRDLNDNVYYKLAGEKAEILSPILSNDFDAIDIMPEINTAKPHKYDESITETEPIGPIKDLCIKY